MRKQIIISFNESSFEQYEPSTISIKVEGDPSSFDFQRMVEMFIAKVMQVKKEPYDHF